MNRIHLRVLEPETGQVKGTDYSYPALCFLEIPLEEEVIKEKRVVVDDSIFCHSMSLRL